MSNLSGFKSQSTSTRAVVATFGFFSTALFLLVVATYPTFFLFNPLENGDPIRSTVLVISIIGWLQIALGPAIMFGLYALGYVKVLRALPYVAIFWPTSLIINHVSLFLQEGKWFTGYLLDYPIFIATDILLPLLLVTVWVELRAVIEAPVKHGVHQA